jgi:hypothetical protein
VCVYVKWTNLPEPIFDYKDWSGPGSTVVFTTPAQAGNVEWIKFVVKVYASPDVEVIVYNPDPKNYHYVIPPGKCSENTKDCKVFPGGMEIVCNEVGGGGNTTE